MKSTLAVDWEKSGGLVPAIIQDNDTLQVLMLGYMNDAALAQTLKTKRVTFFSRSKNRLWVKGESSGHYLNLVSLVPDCDSDALLVRVRPHGSVCHRNTCSCFGEDGAKGVGFLAQLERTITQRITANDGTSYTARLIRDGVKRIAQKVGEEGVEVALAAVAGDKEEMASETADLLYHLFVLLRAKEMGLADPLDVLEQRHAIPLKP
jgi:phosphoribosyl-ATP pyrophosphohydrolase/phosphoribosyl-AMP cyclohydrolase